MKKVIILSIIILAALLLFAACSKDECEESGECTLAGHGGACTKGECVFTPLPDTCGDGIVDAGETKCSCPDDAGRCSGVLSGSSHLALACDSAGECKTDLDERDQSLQTHTSPTLRSRGDAFVVISSFNEPFNTRRDAFDIEVYLSEKALSNEDHRITTVEFVGEDSSRNRVILSSQAVNKPLFGQGRELSVKAPLRVALPGKDLEEDLRNLELTIQYEYFVTSASGSSSQQSGSLRVPLRGVILTYVIPSATYECPDSCDDGSAETEDLCNESTGFLCENTPLAGACGDLLCEANENQCSCPEDCGPCSEETRYLRYSCIEAECRASLKSFSSSSESIFDERRLTGFTMQMTYEYPSPFNADDDSVTLKAQVSDLVEGTSAVKITTVRVLDGTRVLGETTGLSVSDSSQTIIDVPLTNLDRAEKERSLTVRVEYEYMQGTEKKTGNVQKTLTKATFLDPLQ